MRFYPEDGSKGKRKQLRRDARYWLGTSRDGPPRLGALLNAVHKLNELLRLTTRGGYRLRIERVENGQWTVPDSATMGEDITDWEEW